MELLSSWNQGCSSTDGSTKLSYKFHSKVKRRWSTGGSSRVQTCRKYDGAVAEGHEESMYLNVCPNTTWCSMVVLYLRTVRYVLVRSLEASLHCTVAAASFVVAYRAGSCQVKRRQPKPAAKSSGSHLQEPCLLVQPRLRSSKVQLASVPHPADIARSRPLSRRRQHVLALARNGDIMLSRLPIRPCRVNSRNKVVYTGVSCSMPSLVLVLSSSKHIVSDSSLSPTDIESRLQEA